MARGRHEVEAYGGIMNEHQNNPDATTTSVLFGQVRRASASHKVDTNHGLLRNRHFTGQHTVLYLGDLATALLGHLQNAETPTVGETPGFNEQRWSLTTQNGDLHVSPLLGVRIVDGWLSQRHPPSGTEGTSQSTRA